MNGTNWFNSAAAPGGGPNLGASSSSLFGNSSINNNNPQQPGGGGNGGLFGNSSTTTTNNNNNLNGSTLFGGNNNGGIPNSPSSAAFGIQARNGAANQSQDIPATEYNENQRLQNKYLESFTPGGNKKKGAGATKITSSPTGGPMGAFTEPSRFGSNSLYGSGAGVSPNKSSHRLSNNNNNNTTSTNRDTSQSTSSPLGNSSMSVRSRMSTGGSASEERPGQGHSHSYGYTGYGGGAGGMGEDPERPPVRSYADDDGAELTGQTTQGQGQWQGQGMGGGMEDEDGMRFDDDTDGPAHMLMVYGLPPSKQDRLQSFLSSFGTLTHFQVGPMDSNYIVVAFDDPSVALRLQRQSGEVRMDGWYLGFRGLSEGAVPEAWSRSKSGGGQLEVRRNGEGNHGHAESHAMDVRPPSNATTTTTAPNNNNNKNSDDPFASISTLTPIKSGGSVFRPSATSASNGQQQQQQQRVDPRFAFGTGQQQQQQQQQQTGQQQQGGGGYGFFGKISDVMFGH